MVVTDCYKVVSAFNFSGIGRIPGQLSVPKNAKVGIKEFTMNTKRKDKTDTSCFLLDKDYLL